MLKRINLDGERDIPANMLSYGKSRSLEISMALATDPDLVMLDEPTASMDAQLEERVLAHLFEGMDENAVVIMATHKSGVMKYANRVIVMESGRIAIDGPKEKVIEELNKQISARRSS